MSPRNRNRAGSRSLRLLLALLVAGSLDQGKGGPAHASSTGTVALFRPQGATATTANGDYISDTTGLGGGTYYSYFIEVPSGLARLVVDLFDADVGLGGAGEVAAQRDRSRGAGYNTSFTYTLYNPSVTSVATTTGDVTGPAGSDNAWLNLYDTYDASTAPAFGTSSTATQGTDSGSITIAPPASTAAGDLLLLMVNKDGSGNVATPSGWTLINQGDCDSGACDLGVYYKIATSSEPANYTISWTGSEQGVAGILRYTGANTTDPIDTSGAATGDSANPQAPSVTTGVTNTRVVRIYGADDDDLSGTPYPGSHTGRVNLESNTGGGTASGGAADTTQATEAATGTASFALSASEQWRAVTVAIRGTPQTLPNGHWELRVDAGSGDDINAIGMRAHDGTPGAGGTELPMYYDSFTSVGVNPNGTQSNTYDVFPWVTSGCTAESNDFDYDSDATADVGNLVYTSRTAAFTQTFDNNALSVDDSWNRDQIPRWTTDQDSTEYGIWRQDVEINTYGGGPSGNYSVLYVGNSSVGANPPTAHPSADVFRVYLPTDTSATTAPVKPYLEQQIRFDGTGGGATGGVGGYLVYGITVRLVNPTATAVVFASSGTTGNVVAANVPGSGAVYIGSSASASQGTVTAQPADLGTGDVVWAPSTLAAGATALLEYNVRLGPFTAGGRIVATGTPTTNGTDASYVDETGNTSQGRATYTLGPLCELAATQGVVDYVLLTRLEAVSEGGQAVLEWDTAGEVGPAGFVVYRRDPSSGDWLRLHEGLLPASPEAPEGGSYRFADTEAAPDGEHEYLLAEVDLAGTTTFFGPTFLRPATSRDSAAALPFDPMGFSLAPHALPPPPRARRERTAPPITSGDTRPTALKLFVRERGFYFVSAQELEQHLQVSAQEVSAWIQNAQLKLTWQGTNVDWLPTGDASGLYFFANPEPSQLRADDVYVLTPGPGGRTMRIESARPRTRPREAPAFDEQILFEQERFAATALPLDVRSDYWFWEALLAGHPVAGTRNVAFDVADPTGAGDALLKVRFQSATNLGTPGEHRAVVALNGTTLGSREWSGRRAVELWLHAPASLLVPGGNTLTLTADGTPGAVFYFNEVSLAYERLATARGNELFVRSNPTTLAQIGGFTDPEVWVLDLALWRRPVWLVEAVIADQGGSYQVTFDAEAGRRYYALTPDAVRRPTIVPDLPSPISTAGADYLVITGSTLIDAARAIADHRAAQGLRTLVVDVADVYDAFSHGRPDPYAIQTFVRAAHQSWQRKPRFVLLVGDGSSDYRDLRGYGGNLVPPIMVTTDYGIFAADGAFTDVLGNDNVPDIPVGRLPAQQPSEVRTYLDHVAAYEQGPPVMPYDLILVSDNPDGAADFGAQHQGLRAYHEGRFVLDHLDLTTLDLATVRADLLAYTSAGSSVVNYLGHGGSTQLAEEGILTRQDAAALTNGDELFVLSALTCTLNRFELPGFRTLGEDLVLGSAGGAGAVWSASGLSLHTEAAELGAAWLNALRDRPSPHVGELALRALRSYLDGGSGDPGAIVSMNLLGDPALRLRLAEAPPPGPPGGPGASDE